MQTNTAFRSLAACLMLPALGSLAPSCSPHVEEDYYGTRMEPIVLPGGRLYDSSGWAHDREGPDYATPQARKLRFRDAWMSFHNYDTPEVAVDHLEAFEAWYSATPTGGVRDGEEEAFILELLG